MSYDWKSLIRNTAPGIAAALGTPAAGMAVKFLATSFLGDEDASEQDVAEAILHASPDKLMELQSLDRDFQLKMQQIGVDIFGLEVDDRKNARETLKLSMWPQIILSTIFILGYFIVVYLLFSGQVVLNDDIKEISYILLGVMTGEIPRIMSFWFGSSHGSQKKDHKK